MLPLLTAPAQYSNSQCTDSFCQDKLDLRTKELGTNHGILTATVLLSTEYDVRTMEFLVADALASKRKFHVTDAVASKRKYCTCHVQLVASDQ